MISSSHFSTKREQLDEELSRGYFRSRRQKPAPLGAPQLRDYFEPERLDQLQFDYHVCLIGEKFETAYTLPYGPKKDAKLRAAHRAYAKLHARTAKKRQSLIAAFNDLKLQNNYYHKTFNKFEGAASFLALAPSVLSITAVCTSVITRSIEIGAALILLPFAAIHFRETLFEPALAAAAEARDKNDEQTRILCAVNREKQDIEADRLRTLESVMQDIRRGPLRPRLVVYNKALPVRDAG